MFLLGSMMLVGILAIAAELWALWRLARGSCTLNSRQLWFALVAGILLSVGSPFFGYFYSDWQWVVGIPFPAAVFELSNGVWLDFVGPITLLFQTLNAGVFLGGPLAATVIIHELRNKSDRECQAVVREGA